MQAIQGTYDDGIFNLEKQIPVKKSKIIVLFHDDLSEEKNISFKMTKEEALHILDKYKGSIKGNFDAETERNNYLYEKYGSVD